MSSTTLLKVQSDFQGGVGLSGSGGRLTTVTPNPARLDPDALLAGLDPQQRQVAEAVSGAVVVLAGAGTGKTRAITHRIAYAAATGAHDPSRTLAVTFTTRAAGEMTRRLFNLGVPEVRVRTFHSAALRQLRWAWPDAIGGSMHDVIASKAGLISAATSSAGVSADNATIRDLATEIEWAKAMQVSYGQYATAAVTQGRRAAAGLTWEQISSVYESYERIKRDAGKIDFEDVLLLTVGILEEREDMRRKVQASFAQFTVDEFQDVSGVQQRLLDLWLGDRDDVCVVGDVAQTIYSFAGANPTYLRNFGAKHKGSTVLHLTRCYRCSPQIVEMAERVLAGSPEAAGPATDASGKRQVRQPLKSQNPDGRRPMRQVFADEKSEAAGVVGQIADLIKAGTPAKEIAILVRINAITEAFESALADAGIPYSVRGGRRFFERPEVRRAVSLLRGATKAAAGAGPAEAESASESVRSILGSAGWTANPPAQTGAVRESWESLSALVALADEMVGQDSNASLIDLVNEIARREGAQDAPSVDGVTLASLHSAKGMEWDAVFLVGLVDGVMPMSHAITPDQLDEERRLFYVGITRARVFLSMSWAKARIAGGRNRRESRFTAELSGGGVAAAVAGAAGGRKITKRTPARCRVCSKALVTAPERSIGRCRTCPGTMNEDLLLKLRDWRNDEVVRQSAEKGSSMPAYVIATDLTLTAIAELQPTTVEDLAAIPGMGPKKLEQFGEQLVSLVSAAK